MQPFWNADSPSSTPNLLLLPLLSVPSSPPPLLSSSPPHLPELGLRFSRLLNLNDGPLHLCVRPPGVQGLGQILVPEEANTPERQTRRRLLRETTCSGGRLSGTSDTSHSRPTCFMFILMNRQLMWKILCLLAVKCRLKANYNIYNRCTPNNNTQYQQ